MSSKTSITAVLLAKNESEIISKCLESLTGLDQIIVGIDSTSDDDTEKIVRNFKGAPVEVLVIDTSVGFGRAKNILIDSVKTPWCLIIDADETVLPRLRDELNGLAADDLCAYAIDFDTQILGRVMNYGGWQETHTRLIRPDKCRYTDKPVHEELVVDGSTGKLEGRILHNTHRTISSIIAKVNLYSSYEAEHIAATYTKRIGSFKLLYEGMRHFVARYFVRQGWRDGQEGFIEAVTQGYSIYIQWAKAWEIQRKVAKTHVSKD